MTKHNLYNLRWFNLLFIFVLLVSGCSPKLLPGFQELASREDERLQRAAEEKIKTKPVFQEVHRLCTQEIPIYEGFALSGFNSFGRTINIAYHYNSKARWQDIKLFYKSYFSDHGWELIEEQEGSWIENNFKIKKNDYQITISDIKDDQFVIYCEKSGEAEPIRQSEKP